MTNQLTLVAIMVAASACAGTSRRPTSPVRYACGETTVMRTGEKLLVDANKPEGPAQLGWSDGDGDHFLTRPLDTNIEAVEYIVPHDSRKDAVVKRYDATAGYSTSDWRLLDKQVCRAHGGYTDALTRWMSGDSLDKVAADLSLDRSSARTLVRKALAQLQKQYFNDR